jgi:hypothetical protein
MHRIAEQPLDHPPLAIAECLLAMDREIVGDRTAGRFLDLAVGIDEGITGRGRRLTQLLPALISRP